MQEFYTDTIISRFIKYFLSNVDIPLLTCVNINQQIYQGITYLFNNSVIKCTKSGSLLSGDSSKSAEYEILVTNATPEITPNTYYSFNSTTTYYDPETHKHLGNYLRYLRDCYDLNLMPYYNCYSEKTIAGITLHLPNAEGKTFTFDKNTSNDKYKLFVVPIKFNCKYTIAIQSDTPVLMRPVIWNNGLVKDANKTSETYLSDLEYLQNSFKIIGNSAFNHPLTYSVDLPEDINIDNNYSSFRQLLENESNLYLLIQVDSYNTSSLVVLEGDYTDAGVISRYQAKLNVSEYLPVQKYQGPSNLSLLRFNSGVSHPFSSRLIEYLLGHVIHKHETLSGNIKNIQKAISKIYGDITNVDDSVYMKNYTLGIWSSKLEQDIDSIIKLLNTDYQYLTDIDHNVNKDVELLLWQKGGLDLASIR